MSEASKTSEEEVKVALERFKRMADQLLYEDHHCKLTSKVLEIKNYKASISSKFIRLKDIKTVYYSKQRTFPGKEALQINDNGWSTSGRIWWALDPLRQTFNTGDKYNVVVDTGEEWKKGFSVVDMNGFGYYLFDLLGSQATFYDGLPNEPMSLNNPPLFH
uniref:Uncharacterized protein n=1 Tax=Acrobeloides nanus TaxID=290746 RepID=A0A914DWD1_9BILA